MHNDENALKLAAAAWMAGSTLREQRRRLKRYTYGDQWSDPVRLPSGLTVSEGEAAGNGGERPMTNNLIRQLVKSVVGLYRRDFCQNDCGTDAATARRNSLREMDARMLEEFLISGCAVQRVVAEKRLDGEGVWVDNVSPERFFVNRYLDPRGADIEVAGMIHEMSLRELTVRLGRHDTARRRAIERIYLNPDINRADRSNTGYSSKAIEEMMRPSSPGRCRAVELWTLETRSITRCYDPESGSAFAVDPEEEAKLRRINRRRKSHRTATKPDNTHRPISWKRCDTLRWHCRWIAPDGTVMAEYDSPWPHGRHPFAIKMYPLTDGEIHSFVEDVVDQQRIINRMITLMEKIMSVSAKGVLLFPTDRLPSDLSWADLADLWSRPGAIVPFKPSERSSEPRQLTTSGDCGAHQMLQIQTSMLEQISGVNSSLQGRDTTGNTSAALYDARTRNATTALIDLIEAFATFVDSRNRLIDGIQSETRTETYA